MTYHAITKYLTLFASFASGFTLRDLLSFAGHKIHAWRERRIDNRLVAYLVREVKLNPLGESDSYGHSRVLYYRSSIDIAKALKRSAVDVRKRLDRLEHENRVHRRRASDTWTASEYEMHDRSPSA